MSARPVLRGLLQRKLKKDFAVATGLTVVACTLWRYGYQNRINQKMDDYFKNLDPEAEFQKLVKAGVYQCIDKEGNINTNDW